MGGVTTTTIGSTLFGTDGYVTVNGVDIGATIGDITVEFGAAHYYPDYAQARGNLQGSGVVIDGFFRIKVTMAEHSWTTLAAVMGSVGSDSTGTSYKFGGKAMAIPVEVTNVIVTGVRRNDLKAWKATIPAAYTEFSELVLMEKQESGLEVTFHGLYTVALPTTLPGYIEIEK